MTGKAKRTETELKALVMQEIRKYPECRNIQDVLIEPQPQQSPNWRCSWVMDAAALRPARALEIERMLQREYDLS
jgi:hypothetical protein